MSHPDSNTEVSLEPTEGWHCSHLYYTFNRSRLAGLSADELIAGRQAFIHYLNADADYAPERLQVSIASGGKADFGLMLLDPNPLKIDAIHQLLMSSPLGKALDVAYSFVSLTEVSEYVPSVEQYGQRLVEEGEEAGSPAYEAKLKAYAGREAMMRKQRLTPDLPPWPSMCFYPMNKKRKVGENWFSLPFEDRNRMMAEHGRSGMAFGGKVTQLITVGIGLEDWEWGVTLWARNPEFLRDIVYKMRFDEASARYAEFGPFFTSYVATAEQVLDHCRVGVA
ncbi:MAG: heme-dependent peroxidase [Planctomycetales bacterium]|nr:heme-dependent peroxidase [Planctomycetales bacterium]